MLTGKKKILLLHISNTVIRYDGALVGIRFCMAPRDQTDLGGKTWVRQVLGGLFYQRRSMLEWRSNFPAVGKLLGPRQPLVRNVGPEDSLL